MDLDLRKLRYFVTVANRLHFGRAADELHIAQPVLSRQIRALEQDLGASLFTRDSHGVALTDAGLRTAGRRRSAARLHARGPAPGVRGRPRQPHGWWSAFGPASRSSRRRGRSRPGIRTWSWTCSEWNGTTRP